MYKIQVYLPPEALCAIRKAIEEAGGGEIGNYKGCMSWWKVRSSWITMDGAHPYNGKIGERTEAEEYILQCRVDEAHLPVVVSAIKKAHPYEEPVVDVVKLDEKSFLPV
ncbi:hypothetical protein [Dialister sp. UBA1703]|uniref:hypothetical protein n=1 Tax=Dialister sp. UBA1703 TaxID=1946415 RepID=UPI0025C57180|nr:hypothetical protein [Dialister sp. UBA1703]